MPRSTSTNGYNSHGRKAKNARIACRLKLKALNLQESTLSMSAEKLHDLAMEWWAFLRKRLYNNKLPMAEIRIVPSIIGADGRHDFGNTIISRETDDDEEADEDEEAEEEADCVVLLSKSRCKTMKLFIGTILHECAHAAASLIYDEQDQTTCQAPLFLEQVELMHAMFDIKPRVFINKIRLPSW